MMCYSHSWEAVTEWHSRPQQHPASTPFPFNHLQLSAHLTACLHTAGAQIPLQIHHTCLSELRHLRWIYVGFNLKVLRLDGNFNRTPVFILVNKFCILILSKT
jgi:hypothetical protein